MTYITGGVVGLHSAPVLLGSNRRGTQVAKAGSAGISRREVIKRGAVAGSIIWAAPVVESFTNAAFGQTAGSPPCTCTVCIGVSFGGQNQVTFCTLDANSCAC